MSEFLVSYAGVWPGQVTLSLEEVIEKAAALHCEGITIIGRRPHASPLDMSAERRRRVRDLMREKSLALAAIGGSNDFCVDAHHIPHREMQVFWISELAQLAKDLGGDMVRLFTGYERSSVPYEQAWAWCVAALKESARRAGDFGVTLCVQNNLDVGAHYESLFDLLSEVDEPNCKAAFDAWSPALHGTDLAAAVKKMAPFIAYTSVADYVRRPRFVCNPPIVNYEQQADAIRAVPMGEGFIDYRTFLGTMKEIGYNGFVGYEISSVIQGGGSEDNLDRCARQFVQWMKQNGFVK
jgi:sugar phosphate isomerase/epimerase